MRVTPCSFTSSAAIDVTGLMLVRFGCAMREPVTTTSWILGFGSCACAGAIAATAALASNAQRTARWIEMLFDMTGVLLMLFGSHTPSVSPDIGNLRKKGTSRSAFYACRVRHTH